MNGIDLEGLRARDPHTQLWNVIVESPKGSRNKFKYDEKRRLFMLSSVLPAGAVFPFDMGFLPSTLGEDGDPLDMLVLMDEPAFAGCLVPCRVVGVIEADQTERDGKTERNDRLICVAEQSHTHRDIRKLDDFPDALIDQIEHFFVSYNQLKGKVFAPLARRGPKEAERLIAEGVRRFDG